MKKYRNKIETVKIGKRIQHFREVAELSISDVADMTGFTYPTIASIEGGEESTISYIIEICKAIGVHPSELFNMPFSLKPRNKLSPQKAERIFLTQRITALNKDSDFFDTPRFVRDVLLYLNDEFEIKANSTSVAVVLKRLADSGKLKIKKSGRQNLYQRRKR